MSQQYTNELSPEIVAGLAQSPFSAENLSAMSDEAREIIETQDDYLLQHPVIAIWRQATIGSLTRDGGTVSSASSGGEVMASHGEFVGFAVVGDEVRYPDGSVARIVSGAGSALSHGGRGFALVGSHLDNGDEIISTPQSYGVIACRAGETMPDDFLVPVLLTTN